MFPLFVSSWLVLLISFVGTIPLCMSFALRPSASSSVRQLLFLSKPSKSTTRLWDQEQTSQQQQQDVNGVTATNPNGSSSMWGSWNATTESLGALWMQLQMRNQQVAGDGNVDSIGNSKDASVEVLDPLRPEQQQPSPQTPKNNIPNVSSSSPIPTSSTSTSSSFVIDWETARELDDAVTVMDTYSDFNVLQQQQVELPLNSMYTSFAFQNTTTRLSQNIEEMEDDDVVFARDVVVDARYTALSVAAAIETVDQWRLFCQEGGGLYPILLIIRQGARSIRMNAQRKISVMSTPVTSRTTTTLVPSTQGKSQATFSSFPGAPSPTVPTTTVSTNNREEALFHAACIACRVLRDLCAISPELAAVLTDGFLRANSAWKGQLLKDLQTLLTYDNHVNFNYNSDDSQNDMISMMNNINRVNNNFSANAATNKGIDPEQQKQRRRRRRRRQRFGRPWTSVAAASSFFWTARDRQRIGLLRSNLHVHQLLLVLLVVSDDAVTAIRATDGLTDVLWKASSLGATGGGGVPAPAGTTAGRRGPLQERRPLRWFRNNSGGELFSKWLSTTTATAFKSATAARGTDISENARDQETKVNGSSFSTFTASVEDENTPLRMTETARVAKELDNQVQRTANQILAGVGYNRWVPKTPGQRGLRILAMDGGGARGMSAVTVANCITEAMSGLEVADAFDMVVGTSTGGIIAFLVGLLRESTSKAVSRYNQLIKQIFVKSALSTPLLVFTTASYDESHLMKILSRILGDAIMLDSRADPKVPLVFCVTSKMSSTPTHVALFRNYNYPGGELADPFTIDPEAAREELGLPLALEHKVIRDATYARKPVSTEVSPGIRISQDGSRHPGSFRVLQRYALRASTAAPTFFKPVMMGGEMYCDGGIVASNPTAVAIHEARTVFPDVPIELVVSIGTGAFWEQKSAPRIGWDGILGQIVDSATNAEQIHHILEDILGAPSDKLGHEKSAVSKTKYFRFNPVIGLPNSYAIDETDPEKLERLQQISKAYMAEPEQVNKLKEIAQILGVPYRPANRSTERR